KSIGGQGEERAGRRRGRKRESRWQRGGEPANIERRGIDRFAEEPGSAEFRASGDHSGRRGRCLQKYHQRFEYLHRSRYIERRLRNCKMKIARSAAGLCGLAMLFWFVHVDLAQPPPGQRPPPPQGPVARALPAEDTPETPSAETEQPEKRQLEYANALFTRKLYDLAIPEYQK